MAVVTKKSAMATILILVGIISSVFIIGIILIIIGVMMRRKGKGFLPMSPLQLQGMKETSNIHTEAI